MKIRSGFVSNSSSSSFCIYGTSMDFGEVIEKVKEMNILTEDEMEQIEEDDSLLEEYLSDKTDLAIYVNEDQFWMGRSWASIKDDETGAQFKESVKAEVEKLFGADLECGTHEEEIQNY